MTCSASLHWGIRRTLGTHFISSLLLCSVSLCVITSWELAEGPTSLLRSVLLLSLLWHWLLLCACVPVCVCMRLCVQPKPTLETALKHWQCGVMPCLSYCLSRIYFSLWAPHSIYLCSRLTATPEQVTQAWAWSPAVWPPRPWAPPGSSGLLASVSISSWSLRCRQITPTSPPFNLAHTQITAISFHACSDTFSLHMPTIHLVLSRA